MNRNTSEIVALSLLSAGSSMATGVFAALGDWDTSWRLSVLSVLFVIAGKIERLPRAQS